MADKTNLVHIEIFGQTYAVKGGADPSYVERLGAYLDNQMKEVSRASGAVDSVRIAVLAGLNIADELFRLKEQGQKGEGEAAHRAARLARELSSVLEE
jgi:cell division protein ZapA